MTSNRTCAQCGAALPDGGLEGHCLACLLSLALLEEESPSGVSDPGAPKNRRYFRDYELLEEISRGAMGVVYRARQLGLNRMVALKMILEGAEASPAFVARFQFEAEAAAQLAHPNIVRIYEIGEDQGRYFFSMELLEGGNLAQRLEEFALAESAHLSRTEALERQRQIARLMATVAGAVSHAHQHGILHRDLKPANILFDAESEPHVADFGLAKLLEQENLLTRPGTLLGTPAYVAPEQAVGNQQTTTAADIYSLGAILCHLLTGKPPFQAGNPLETIRQLIEKEASLPARLHPLVDRALAAICLKCLRKDPADRYTSARALAEDLERWIRGDPVVAAPPSAAKLVWRWCRRKPALAAMSAAILVLLAAITAVSIAGQKRTTDKLWESYLAQARALRWSGRPGRQFEALEAIRRAAAIRPSVDLRSEAIAALAQIDLRRLDSSEAWPKLGLPPALQAGQKLVFDWASDRFETAEADGSISIRRRYSGEELARLRPLGAAVDSVGGFTGDGRWLNVNYKDGRTCFWDVAQREPAFQLTNLISAEFSPDSQRAALCSFEGRLSLLPLNISAGETGAKLISIGEDIHGAQWRPDGAALACLGDSNVVLLAAENGAVARRMALPTVPYCCAWRPDGGQVAVGGDDGAIYVFDSKSGQSVFTFAGHLEATVGLSYSPDGMMLASGSWDGRLKLWNMETGKEMLSAAAGALRICFAPDGKRLALYDAPELGPGIWEIGANDAMIDLGSDYQRHPTRGDALLFGAGDEWVATSMDEALTFWDPRSGARLARFEDQPCATLLPVADGSIFCWLPDGFYRMPTASFRLQGASAANRFGAEIPQNWQGAWLVNGSNVFSAERPAQRSAVSRDGRAAAVTMADRCYIFDMAGGRLRAVTGTQRLMKYVAVSPDGTLAATGGWNTPNAQIWSTADGTRERELATGVSPNVAFSPDGRWLVTGTGTEYDFWRTSDWGLERTFKRPGNEGLPGPICFSGDGTLLAVAYDRNDICLLSGQTGATLAMIDPQPERQLIALAFNSDASELAVTRTAAPPQVWDLRRIRGRLAEMKLDW